MQAKLQKMKLYLTYKEIKHLVHVLVKEKTQKKR